MAFSLHGDLAAFPISTRTAGLQDNARCRLAQRSAGEQVVVLCLAVSKHHDEIRSYETPKC